MNTQHKVLSVLAAALAVVFSTAGVSMAFSAPGVLANCHTIESGLSFECDPVSNLAVVNSGGVVPVTGFSSLDLADFMNGVSNFVQGSDSLSLSDFVLASQLSPVTSLRGVNDFTSSANELILADFVANPSATDLILADFVANPSATELILADFVANPNVVATSLHGINEESLGADDLSLSDAALAFQAKDSMMMKALPAAYNFVSR